MNRIRFLITVFLCSLALSHVDVVFAKTTIRFATVAPEGSSWMKVIRQFADEVEEKTNSEVVVKFYPNMVMGDEKDVVRKMRLGQIQAGGFTGVGLGEILPESRILELPYLFQDYAEVDFIKERYFDHFSDAYAEKGFILLGWADVGWVYFLSNDQITSPEDLKSTKVWSWEGDPLAEAFFKELKKEPIYLTLPEVLLGLQTGMVNAVYSPPLPAIALQWFTRVDYISDIPFTHSMGAVLLDKKMFDRLKPDNQEVVLESGRKYLKQLVMESRKENAEAFTQILNQGVEKVGSTEIERQKMRQTGLIVHQSVAGDLFPADLLKQIKGELETFRHTNPEDKATP